ncbi:MAG: polymer-forming cytoskeletal protein [Bacteroidales bacterium]|nr:polymer-forming cytoskeletal protein [Bacteroidales bacterium]MBQ7490633.1 polymer-forming cytoskeletal protein [Bacteroidales bacterium]
MATRPEEESGVNVIAEGTTLTGNIVTSGDCRIDGTMKGNIQSNAKVIVGINGIIEGELVCKNLEIEGKVKANVNVGELLALKSNSTLVGNITVGKISIEPGANFIGNCRMQNSKIEVPGQLQEPQNK